MSAQIHYFRHSFGAMNGIFDRTKIVDSARVAERLE